MLLTLYLLVSISSLAQDYIVSWQSDTIKALLPSNPAKEQGLRPGWKYKNGFFLLSVLFKNDSLRVIKPGEIKGYYREKHGKGFLCNGYFESIQVIEGGENKTNTEGKNEADWYFMQPVYIGKFASLYKRMRINKRQSTLFYLVKHTSKNNRKGLFVVTRKNFIDHLQVPGNNEAMERFIKKNKLYDKFVMEYNRLMELDIELKK